MTIKIKQYDDRQIRHFTEAEYPETEALLKVSGVVCRQHSGLCRSLCRNCVVPAELYPYRSVSLQLSK